MKVHQTVLYGFYFKNKIVNGFRMDMSEGFDCVSQATP